MLRLIQINSDLQDLHLLVRIAYNKEFEYFQLKVFFSLEDFSVESAIEYWQLH